MSLQILANFTALGIATYKGHTDVVTALVAAGADVNHRTITVMFGGTDIA
jgi:ankyrin repeat protein